MQELRWGHVLLAVRVDAHRCGNRPCVRWGRVNAHYANSKSMIGIDEAAEKLLLHHRPSALLTVFKRAAVSWCLPGP